MFTSKNNPKQRAQRLNQGEHARAIGVLPRYQAMQHWKPKHMRKVGQR